MKSILLSLLKPKAILVGAAVFNFIVVYLKAKSVEGMMFCFGSPWYIFEMYAYFPLLLLVAALGLYVGKLWGYLTGVAFSAPIIYHLILNFVLAVSFSSWWSEIEYQPGLGFQFAFAIAISCLAVIGMVRNMSQRKWPVA